MVIPIFRVFDVEKAHQFYLTYLGFKLDWEHRYEENMPLYVQVSRNDVVIHLSEHHGDASPGSAIRIHMPNLHEYLAQLNEKGYRYMRPQIERTPWGMMELCVIDPFSNRIVFYEPEK